MPLQDGTYEQLRPIGETLIMPLRYSTNVPLGSVVSYGSKGSTPHGEVRNYASSPLDGNIQLADVAQDEVDQFLILLLPDFFDEACGFQLSTEFERS